MWFLLHSSPAIDSGRQPSPFGRTSGTSFFVMRKFVGRVGMLLDIRQSMPASLPPSLLGIISNANRNKELKRVITLHTSWLPLLSPFDKGG